MGDGGQGARRDDHSHRPAVHANVGDGSTPMFRFAPAATSPSLAESSTTSSARRSTSASTSSATRTPRPSSARISRTPINSAASSPASTRRRERMTPRAGPTRGWTSPPPRDRARCRRRRRARRLRGTSWRTRPTAAASRRDESLEDPFCVFQILKRHYARYTPEVVEQICGVPADQFAKVCEAVTANSGRERTTAWVYSVGWTQHSVGVQYIRGAAIIQLLLGNMGRPGGGILALRGHASIQGSTDIPTLFDLLPGYLPMPKAGRARNHEDYLVVNQKRRTERILDSRGHVPHQPAESVVGRCRHCGERLRLRVVAPHQRQSQQLPDHSRHARRQGRGLFPARPESRCRVSERQAPADCDVPLEVARGSRSQPDRIGHVLEGRTGDRDWRAAHRRHRHGGVLPPGCCAHREGRHLHADATPAAVASQGSRALR